MRKVFFYISLVISIFLLMNILKILIADFYRLTEYGFGYLVGKLILFVIFATLMFLTRKHKTKSENEP
jgi:uncharacterized membrane protein required for colicin V production